jgi:hypothetical protein
MFEIENRGRIFSQFEIKLIPPAGNEVYGKSIESSFLARNEFAPRPQFSQKAKLNLSKPDNHGKILSMLNG